jgi:Flp pilus assembly protein TadG
MRRSRLHSVPGSNRGSAAIEFALSFTLLWLLLSGAFRVGYAIYAYESLLNAVAGAARYAARVEFDEPNHLFVSSVKNMAVYGSPTGGGTPLAPELGIGNITVTWTKDNTGLPLTITVAVTGYSVHPVFQTVAWTGKPSVTVHFSGRYVS